MKIKYYPNPCNYQKIEIVRENDKWVAPKPLICPDKYTNIIQSCTDNQITVGSQINMDNQIIENQKILGYKLFENEKIYYWRDVSYNEYIYDTDLSSNTAMLIGVPLYYKLFNYISYGGLIPEYTTDVSNSTRLRIPYDGLYSLTLNLILRPRQTLTTGGFSVQFFLSKNAGTGTTTPLDISRDENLSLSFVKTFPLSSADTGSCNFSNIVFEVHG